MLIDDSSEDVLNMNVIREQSFSWDGEVLLLSGRVLVDVGSLWNRVAVPELAQYCRDVKDYVSEACCHVECSRQRELLRSLKLGVDGLSRRLVEAEEAVRTNDGIHDGDTNMSRVIVQKGVLDFCTVKCLVEHLFARAMCVGIEPPASMAFVEGVVRWITPMMRDQAIVFESFTRSRCMVLETGLNEVRERVQEKV
jgi:hypothetical protein